MEIIKLDFFSFFSYNIINNLEQMNFNSFFSNNPDFIDETGQDSPKSAKVVSVCPICKMGYQPSSIDILGENHNSYLIYFKCQGCQTNSLAVVYLSPKGVIVNNVATDLNRDEIISLVKNKRISDFEVLDLYQALKKEIIFKNN